MHKLLRGVVVVGALLLSATVCHAYEREIKALSDTMVEKLVKAGKKTVAVVDFTDLQGSVTELGRFLAEELSSDLSDSAAGFEVIDRNHLKSLLAEHKLSLSGLVDPTTVKQMGQIAGVDAIVTGSVTPFGDSIRVSAKVIATDTARIIASAKGDLAKTKAIEELLAKGIETRGSPEAAPSEGGSSAFSTPTFSVLLSPATRTERNISVKASVHNTTSGPIFIALNQLQPPSLTDDKFGLTAGYYTHSGVGWSRMHLNGREKEEENYTRLLPNQRLDIGMIFYTYPRGTPEADSAIHVTMDFITLKGGKVERVSATPGGPMKFQ